MRILKLFIGSILLLNLVGISELTFAKAKADKETETTKKEQIGDLVTLNFRDSPIQEVFDVLSRKDKVNIILGKGLTGNVTVNLYNISIRDAIYRVAEAAGLAVEYRNGDYLILDRKETGQEHPGGLTQLRTFKVQYSDPKQVADILTKYLSRYGKVTPLIDRRMIVVEDTPEFIDRTAKLLQELDVQPNQIMIEAKVLEVTLDNSEIYGIDWNKIIGGGQTTGGIGSNSSTYIGNGNSPKQQGFYFGLANKNLSMFLEAQETRNRVKTLATPKLLAMENQEAKTIIGNKTGYKLTTTINQVTSESVEFIDSGVILTVTPTVDQQGRVRLKVHPEVSSVRINAGIPDKKSTEVTTELLCEDGQSVFIGGLIKSVSSKDRSGVPVLGSIPGIGVLFSTTNESTSNTETVVIITPKIVREPSVMREVSKKKIDQIRDESAAIASHQTELESTQFKDKFNIRDHVLFEKGLGKGN